MVPIEVINQTGANDLPPAGEPVGQRNWGEDELGSEQIISPSFSAAVEQPGVPHDVKATDCRDETVAVAFDVPVGEPDTLVRGG